MTITTAQKETKTNKSAVVLDQFGQPWGIVSDIEESVRTIDVFSDTTTDGTPVNVKTRKVSRAKKNFKHFEEQFGDYFVQYGFGGHIYYKVA